ncbi:MAG: CCA tRNA nucleotidyltransferase [Alphaproteobacteria bacterium]
MEPARHIEPVNWMRDPETTSVFAALAAPARFVGGCVRDVLLDRPVTDIDIATTLTPDAVMQRLDAAGIRAVPTGFDHGTVTAVTDHRHFEITTLRIDVRTDGRRAEVSFTDDWIADAQRRDFTVNALYCEPDGALYDPVGGLADLDARRVRFVGDPAQRLVEDVLRLLRFFRFHAQFGAPPLDAAGLAACRAAAGRLTTLAGERIAHEMLRLLAAGDPAPTLVTMSANGIFAPILPEARAIDRLAALVTLEGIVDGAVPVRRLAAMVEADAAGAADIAARWRLSNADRKRLVALCREPALDPEQPKAYQRAELYRSGADLWHDRVLVSWADEVSHGVPQDRRRSEGWRAVYDLPVSDPPPAFPLRGQDALERGVPPGPEVGSLLDAVEQWWIDGDFGADRAACLNRLEALRPEADRVAED